MCSSTWNSILFGAELLAKGMIWRVGKGDLAKFWTDKWLFDTPLMQHNGVLNIQDLNCNVDNFFRNGWWNVDQLRNALSEDLVQKITAVPVGFGNSVHDAQIWGMSSNGLFSVKSAYSIFFRELGDVDPFWNDLWRMKIPPKIHIFIWLAYQGKILSNEQRTKRNLTSYPSCLLCGWQTESVIHILKDCPLAMMVWKSILNLHSSPHFFLSELKPWFLGNLLSKVKGPNGIGWNVIFAITC